MQEYNETPKQIIDPLHLTDDDLIDNYYWGNESGAQKFQKIANKFFLIAPCFFVGLEDFSFPIIKEKEYAKIRNIFSTGTKNLSEKNQLAYKAFLLFETADKFLSFIKRNKNSLGNISTPALMRAVSFPDPEHWYHINFREWGDAFLDHGYRRVKPLFYIDSPFIDPVRNHGRISLKMTEFQSTAREFGNIDLGIRNEISNLSRTFNLSMNEHARALDIYSKKSNKPQKKIPPLIVQGHSFNLSGATFHRLDHNDPRKLFLGHYTGCCEKISDETDNIENTIEHSFRTAQSEFYVVSKNDNILAHSWAWRGKQDELVFDGFETKRNSGFHAGTMTQLLKQVRKQIEAPQFTSYGLKDLFIGQCTSHLEETRKDFHRYEYSTEIKPEDLLKNGIGMNNQSKCRLYQVRTP